MSGKRTLGEYLWDRRTRRLPIRARADQSRAKDGKTLYDGLYPTREMVAHELSRIREAQQRHHPRISAADWDLILHTILHQRPLKPVERGKCPLLPDHDRALKADPLFQRFRILVETANLRVAPPGQSYRRLTDAERSAVVRKLLQVRDRDLRPDPQAAQAPSGEPGSATRRTTAAASTAISPRTCSADATCSAPAGGN